MNCNICGCEEFYDWGGRRNIRCRQCGSVERHRILYLILSGNIGITRSSRILHLAPEKSIYSKIIGLVDEENYHIADYHPTRFTFTKKCKKIDLCNLDTWDSNYYDFIIHSHVLEHVLCNIAYPLYHLHRMLSMEGVHLFSVPFLKDEYDECFQELDKNESVRRFGQSDHCRSFGRKDLNRHLGKILNVPMEYDATKLFDVNILKNINIPNDRWFGFNGSSYFMLKKHDMKFLRS